MSPQQLLSRVARLEERVRGMRYHIRRLDEHLQGVEFDLSEVRKQAEHERLEEHATHVDPHPVVRA